MVFVGDLSPSLPEMEPSRWVALSGESLELRLATRAILLAHAAGLTNRFVIASLWNQRRSVLRGLALAVQEVHSGGRAVLVVHVPGAHHTSQTTGVWNAEGEDRSEIAYALLVALTEHARTLGIPRLLVGRCPESDRAIAKAAVRIRARPVEAPVDHVIELAAGGDFAAHLAGLDRKRAWKLRRELRRAAERGVSVTTTCVPVDAEIVEAGRLVRDTLALKQPRLIAGAHDLLGQLTEWLPAGSLTLTQCRDSSQLLGVLVGIRAGDTTQFAYFGRVAEPPLQVAAALWPTAVRNEIERGARRLLLGSANDALKRRLGARALAQVHYYVAAC
jgi:hypothetical protein